MFHAACLRPKSRTRVLTGTEIARETWFKTGRDAGRAFAAVVILEGGFRTQAFDGPALSFFGILVRTLTVAIAVHHCEYDRYIMKLCRRKFQ
jgi:hypothetical protein